MEQHRIVTKDHRGNEMVLSKPVNDSAMTQAEKEEWYRQRQEHLQKKAGKK